MAVKFAERTNNMEGSAIRELLKLTQRPEVISFAGGLPAAELFPVEEMREAANKVMDEQGRVAMQYSTTEGYLPLREHIAKRMNDNNFTNIEAKDVLVTNGSQQVLDFLGKAFLDKDDVVLCESPSYLGAINAFNAYQPKFIDVPTDEHGMIMEELEKILAENDKVKFIYVIPDFQNPSGRTWPLERRTKFMEIVNKYEIPVAEDNPYGELRYEGEFLPSLKSLDTKGLVMFLGTFSKILCPGYRLGWVAAEEKILEKFNIIKQAADLQASTVSQLEMSKYFDLFDVDAHVNAIKELYGHRRDVMMNAMTEFFPEGVTWTVPEGGLFTWVILPEQIDAAVLLKEKAIPNNVAFVCGEPFFPNGGHANTFRMNYSCMPDEKIRQGIEILGKAIKEAL